MPGSSIRSSGRRRQVGRRQTSFDIPGYRALWLTGLLWHIARWLTVFATTYRVNELTGNPLLVQLVGSAFMVPMFVGGALAGTVTDRFDRSRTIRIWLVVLAPLSVLMATAIANGQAPLATAYGFVVCVGIGNLLDMTCRRSLAFGLVGPDLITNAAAYETMALHGGTMVGTIAAGALLQSLSPAWAYVSVAAVCLVALGSLTRATQRSQEHRPTDASTLARETRSPSDGGRISDETIEALGLLRTNAVLRQFLMITVLMNFFFYSFTPLIPVFAEDLGVGALLAGLLAAAVGMGSMTGAVVIARIQPSRRGLVHIVGCGGAMAMLIVFANLNWYPAAFAALFAAGLSGSGFGATQSALMISLVPESVRGRALGMLSMAIGALPFGMFSLGVIARRTDPQLAVTACVGTGLIALFIWQARRPHLRALT